MATNIDKAFYQAPQGLDQIAEEEEPLEISIEDPESVTISQGEFTLEIAKTEEEEGFDKNLAEDMDERVLAELAGNLVGDF
jgi:hypothetical protein